MVLVGDHVPAWMRSLKVTPKASDKEAEIQKFWAKRTQSIEASKPEKGKKRGPSKDDGLGKMIPELQNIFVEEILANPSGMARNFSGFKVNVGESSILKSRVILLFIYTRAGPENLRLLLRTKAEDLDALQPVVDMDGTLWTRIKIQFSTVPRRKAFAIMPEATLLQDTVWSPFLALCILGRKKAAVKESPFFLPEEHRGKIVEDVCNYIKPMLGAMRSLLMSTTAALMQPPGTVYAEFLPATTFAVLGEDGKVLDIYHTKIYTISFQYLAVEDMPSARVAPSNAIRYGTVIVPE